jgi:hypothetical protein
MAQMTYVIAGIEDLTLRDEDAGKVIGPKEWRLDLRTVGAPDPADVRLWFGLQVRLQPAGNVAIIEIHPRITAALRAAEDSLAYHSSDWNFSDKDRAALLAVREALAAVSPNRPDQPES